MNMTDYFSSPVCTRLILTLAHFLWQGMAIALLALVVAKLLVRRSPRGRYAIYLVSLFAMLLSVAVTYALVRVPDVPAAEAPVETVSTAEEPREVAAPLAPVLPPGTKAAETLPLQPVDEVVETPEPITVTATKASSPFDWQRVVPYAVGLYLLGVLVMLGRLFMGLQGGQRLRKCSEPVRDEAVLSSLARQARALGLAFTPAIAYCARVVVPTVVGVLRPTILLPFTFATGLSAQQVEMLLAHELAHIRRYDPLFNVLQRVVEAVLFFHPAVWFVSRKARVERENCCDDMVLQSGGTPLAYASSLVETARHGLSVGVKPRLAAEGVRATGRPSQLRARILRLLGGGGHEQVRLRRTWVVGLALVLLTGGLLLALTLRAPSQEVGSDKAAPVTEAADEGDASEVAGTETATVALSGRVIDDETGEPVNDFALQRGWPDPKDASKILWGGFDYSGLHQNGSFSVREGTYKNRKVWVRVLADGYLPQPVTPEPLTAPASAQNLEVRLKRGLEVRGRVVDHAGKAVVGAKVFLGGYRGLELVDGEAEYFYCSRTTTDKDGAFVLAGVGEGADSIIVSAPSLHVWRVPLTKPDEEILIKLPQPATLVLRYDIEGDEDPGQFRLELKTWEMKDWKGVVTSVQMPTVPNKGTTALSNVAPGVYDLVRMKQLRVGRQGRGVLCDRRTITLEAGKALEVEFVRKTGHPITGEVVGLKEAGVPGAFIRVAPAAATGDPRKADEWKLTMFDALTCGEDGQFKTARIPPGTYTVIVHAYKPESPTGVIYENLGIRLPDFIGTAKVTVTEDAPPPPVRIELKPYPNPPGTSSGEADDAAEMPAPEKAPVELSGRVIDDETGELVKRFILQGGWPDPKDPSKIFWGGWSSGRHGDGSFKVRRGWEKGWVRVLADGYLPHPLSPEELAAAVAARHLEVRLKRGLEVRGRVVDHAGKPVAGAKVFLGGYQQLELTDGKAESWGARLYSLKTESGNSYCSRTTTDKDGAFVLSGVGEGANSIIVSAPSLHVWRVPLTKPDEEILITLPQPATLVLRYDIEGDEDPGQFYLRLKTWEMKDWKDVVISVQMPTVPNKGTTALSNVTPGAYDLIRMKQARVGRQGGNMLCERRAITLEAGKTTEVEFVRKTGYPITGEVVGLVEAGVPGAFIYVKPAAATGDPDKVDEWKLTAFDAVTCGEDGRFKTARIPPGTYTVIVHAYKPKPPTNIEYLYRRLPDFIGTAKVTITEDAPPAPVRIELKPYPNPPATSPEKPDNAAEMPAPEKATVALPATRGVTMVKAIHFMAFRLVISGICGSSLRA